MARKRHGRIMKGDTRVAGAEHQDSKTPRHFAVFGDVHGHLRLLFDLCRRWQVAHGVHLDGILQCGDLGYFPDASILDKATRRYAEKDPEELGYATYFAEPDFIHRDPRLQATLLGDPRSLQTVSCRMLWCHGNHEAFAALEGLLQGRELAPVDPHGRLLLLRAGAVVDFCGLRVAALGGASERHTEDRIAEDPLVRRWKYVDPEACMELMDKSFEVLLSHTSPADAGDTPAETVTFGSRWVEEVVHHCQPQFHFFAHHTRPILPFAIKRTRCHWLNDVTFTQNSNGVPGPLERGCMGILQAGGGAGLSFQIVEDPWFMGLGAWNWQHV